MPEVTPSPGPEPGRDWHGSRGGLSGGCAERGQLQALDERVTVARDPFRFWCPPATPAVLAGPAG